MRRFDKTKNIEKANILAEQRYLESKGLIKESNAGVTANVGMLLGIDDSTKSQISSMEVPAEPSGAEMTRLPEDKLHVTLTSIKAFKPFRDTLKGFQLPDNISIPKVVLGNGKFVYRPEQDKITYVLAVENQEELKTFVDAIYQSKGLENPEPDRFFHITVANNAGGDSFKSIGNVVKQDLMEEENNDEIQVWFDLDGVLADMEGSLRKNNELQQLRADLDNTINNEFPDYIGLSNDEIKAKFKAELEANPENEDVRRLKKVFKKYNNRVFKVAGVEGFYANLELIDGAVELVKFAHKVSGKKPNILSSPVGNENNPNNPSVKEKREWVQRHFGGLVDHVEITTDKARVINSEKDILIDDRTKYVDVFTNAGGSAILFKNAKQAASDLEQLISSLNNSGDNQ
jgi:5'(3')-deoxyribonucleotidase/2'-5' RNA ligase